MWKRTIGGGVRAAIVAATVCSMASGSAAAQNTHATSEAPARLSVAVPKAVAGQVVLDLVVTGFQKPEQGNIGGVVTLKRPGDSRTVEVGRFSIFPPESFAAANAGEGKRFQFNITSAWKELGLSGAQAPAQIEVEVVLVDRSNGKVPVGAKLTVGAAEIASR